MALLDDADLEHMRDGWEDTFDKVASTVRLVLSAATGTGRTETWDVIESNYPCSVSPAMRYVPREVMEYDAIYGEQRWSMSTAYDRDLQKEDMVYIDGELFKVESVGETESRQIELLVGLVRAE